jgi:tripartite-type tricarboxylate transporter receptor subunit TctC
VHAPAKTPREIIVKLNAIIVKALAIPEGRQQLANQGIEVGGATPEEFAKFVRSEVDKIAKIIKASGARPE